MKNLSFIIFGVLIVIATLSILSLTGTFSFLQGTAVEELDFCNTEQQCIDFLEEKGMPDNWLEENNIKITCDGGVCNANK